MIANELRKDYLLDRWVVIATERKRRPTDFVQKPTEEIRHKDCPFCPGNEHMTPPATLVYLTENGEIIKEKDSNGFRHKNWIVRCIPNLYPAFSPPNKHETFEIKENRHAKAFGYHEVVIESPRHDEHPGKARISQLIHVINAYLDRLKFFEEKPYVKYVSIFRNHKREGGASLSHAHSQIIATPIIPRIIKEELEASRKEWEKSQKCVFCKIIKKERNGPRFIWENSEFVAFAPWAGVNPFEFWIFPKRHESSPLEMNKDEIRGFAEALRLCLGSLQSLLNDPPYNFGFHIAPVGDYKFYHWHVEVYPRLAIWAGFEKSTGMYINVIPPEDAAKSLREEMNSKLEK